ncbi:MAG TPA: tetratricopeptide repeat protein, partial [Spirochaetia bacterium]|nr:tetratricopeptide repeat protein [Spirochaetia bacterium]
YKDTHRYEQAIAFYRKALDRDPAYILAYNNLGTVLEKSGAHEEALRVYHKGLHYDVRNARLHYNAGVIYGKKNQFREAEQEFALAVKYQPGFVPAQNNLALLLGQRGEYERALTLFKVILKKDPENTEALNNLGVLFAEQQIHGEAKRCYKAALAVNPRYTKARFNLARLLSGTGAEEEALAEFDAILEYEPDHTETHVAAGMLLLHAGKENEADIHFRTVLKLLPDHSDALRGRAQLFLARDNPDGALAVRDRLVRCHPERLELNLDLAAYYQKKGDVSRAEEEIRAYLEVYPDQLHARVMLADVLRAAGRHAEAIDLLRRETGVKARDPEVLLTLAKIYRESRRQEEALALLNEVMAAQGNAREAADAQSLRDTLSLYEETIADYEENFREQWERNLKRYKKLTGTPEQDQLAAGDAILLETSLRVEEDAVPIINIGGLEPVFDIREEEEEVTLEERDDEIPERVLPLPPEPPASLVSLLEGEELYEESPLRDEIRSSRRLRPRPAPPPEWTETTEQKKHSSPAAEPSHPDAAPGRPHFAEIDPAVFSELSARLADSIAALGNTMKQTLETAGAQAALKPPVIYVNQPPPPGEEEETAGGDAPPDREHEESELPMATVPEVEEDVPERAEGGSDAVIIEESEELIHDDEAPDEILSAGAGTDGRLEQASEEHAGDATTGWEGEAPAEEASLDEWDSGEGDEDAEPHADAVEPGETTEKGDGIREELKSFVETVRERLGEDDDVHEQAGEPKKPVKLLDYLSNMTNYLPRESGFRSLENEMRIRVELVRQQLAGKHGLFERIERYFRPSTPAASNGLSPKKIASAFAFIKDLSRHLPDQRMGGVMRDRIDGILLKLRSMPVE